MDTDEVLDLLLDQEGLEVDPLDRLEGDTPLHKAVRFVNELSKNDWEAGLSVVELLTDAGADPRYVLNWESISILGDWKSSRLVLLERY
jgi:hypothetical protein